jgi:hypothetical protein
VNKAGLLAQNIYRSADGNHRRSRTAAYATNLLCATRLRYIFLLYAWHPPDACIRKINWGETIFNQLIEMALRNGNV